MCIYIFLIIIISIIILIIIIVIIIISGRYVEHIKPITSTCLTDM